ncbi:hypothetical protein D3C76_1229300 [compost metagenome]
MDFVVGGTAFDAHRALATGRQAVFDADGAGNAIFETQANQAGCSKNDCVVLAGIQLGQARVDVATQETDLQVWASGQQLRLATQAGGADDTAGRQIFQACISIGYEGVARVFALANAVQAQPLGEVHRHIFHRVHGDVGFLFEQSSFQLLDEQALAANFRQRRVEQLVTAADHGHQRYHKTGMGLLQTGFDIFGLPQGQGTFAGSDADFARGHGSINPY